MSRTTSSAVIEILADNYGAKRDGTLPGVGWAIDTATLIVDKVEACAISKGTPLSTANLEIIERWLSGHVYLAADRPYQSKGTRGASATFQGQTAMSLDSTYYGQMAKDVDPSGCLVDVTSTAKRAKIVWLGKQKADQIESVPGRGR